MNKHTPGPWWIEEHTYHNSLSKYWNIYSGKDRHKKIITLGCDPLGTYVKKPEQEANAHLIAVAPDLLEVCKAALMKCPFPVGAALVREQLQEAISKAEEEK